MVRQTPCGASVLAIGLPLAAAPAVHAQTFPWIDLSLDSGQRADLVLGQMTQEKNLAP